MIKQVQTKNTTCRAIIRTKAFVTGFNEVRSGKPFNYDAYRDANDQWNYERGRQFALVFSGKLKDGAKVTFGAQINLGIALHSKAIF